MISYSGDINKVDMTQQAFGVKEDHTTYTEGPWFYRRGDLYYMLYAANGVPEDIRYSTSPSPTGPWTYRGVIMPKQGGSFTNHCGVVDFQGHSYFAYHNGALPGGGGFQRSVCVEEFTYNPDGSIPEINMTKQGANQLHPVDPYNRIEAETMSWSEGIETEVCSEGGRNVGFIENGDYIKVNWLNFGEGAESFTASASSAGNGGTIELHLDKKDGKLVGSCEIPSTGGWQDWKEFTCPVSGAEGQHDLYLVFKGGSSYLLNVDWWKFNAPEPEVPVITGDIDGDERISVFDMVSAIEGMSDSFPDTRAERAADIDKSGTVEVSDLVLLQKYLCGQIRSFPTADNT
jgi:hypothetical protein